MKQRYLVNIQNMDNLDNVQIEIAPLTILTGDNNSGKSVIMNIVYGILRLSREIITKVDKDSLEYGKCIEFVDKLYESGEGYIDSNIGNMFCDLFNTSLTLNKEIFFNKIFNVSIENNYNRFKNTDIFLSGYKIFPRVLLVVDEFCDDFLLEGDLVRIPKRFFKNKEYILELICDKIIHDGFSDIRLSCPIFLPAGRSSFLGYHDIFKNLKYQNLSTDDFLRNIGSIEFSKLNIYDNIVSYIENEVVFGKFSKDSFTSFANGIEIPINLASDFIKELAPVVMFLRSTENFGSFFIEEIENHLNFKVQRTIVSALVRIVNSGTPIFMSTNSNVILEQLCNFLLLNNLNRDKIDGFGYILNDVLDVDKINIYEFTYEKNKVLVNKLPIDYSGFKVDFNDIVLNEISRENLQLKIEMFENNSRS